MLTYKVYAPLQKLNFAPNFTAFENFRERTWKVMNFEPNFTAFENFSGEKIMRKLFEKI